MINYLSKPNKNSNILVHATDYWYSVGQIIMN